MKLWCAKVFPTYPRGRPYLALHTLSITRQRAKHRAQEAFVQSAWNTLRFVKVEVEVKEL